MDLLSAKTLPLDDSIHESLKGGSRTFNHPVDDMDEQMLFLSGTTKADEDITVESFNNSETTFLNKCITSDTVTDFENEKDETMKTSCLFDATNMTRDNEQLAELNLTQISSDAMNVSPKEYKSDTFYGLPMHVKQILMQNRGISKLYGMYLR